MHSGAGLRSLPNTEMGMDAAEKVEADHEMITSVDRILFRVLTVPHVKLHEYASQLDYLLSLKLPLKSPDCAEEFGHRSYYNRHRTTHTLVHYCPWDARFAENHLLMMHQATNCPEFVSSRER
ncbi:hypothetical protein BV898_02451 [Hypsibius exemplaris]|uniref:C2H2-type domain-containing protein n=1 Tax=Hypsibius exemplaris TaxID=2072580 RepID=A0A1W0X8I0_HYPEX|nr:hypothetical protein BV898_02451 [Hypsibius exemplaris]